MSMKPEAEQMKPVSSLSNAGEVAGVFLKLGTVAFGGPAAHIAMMEEEIVRKRKWVNHDTFLDLLGASNLIPGPNSTELAIHLGYVRAGWIGLLVAGTCFIAPAMGIVWALAAFYSRYQSLPELSSIFNGMTPVIVAIVLQALWGLSKNVMKRTKDMLIGAGVLIGALCGMPEIPMLLAAGLLSLLLNASNNRRSRNNSSLDAVFPAPFLLAGGTAAAGAAKAGLTLSAMFWTFIKIGSVLYGSGYVLLAFLKTEFVGIDGGLTSKQLLDAVAVGQFTPGPLFTTATFVGYLLHGSWGAVLATVGIFLPAFVFVAIINPFVPRLRKSPLFSGFLDGVNAASLALMASVTIQLGRTALSGWFPWLLGAAAAFILFRWKVNSLWLVMGGALLGYLYSLL
jgi:chromate transporter